MKKCLCLLAATILVFSSLANAQVYKSVDANGVVTFSDKPPAQQREAIEEINLPTQVNTVQAISVAPAEPKPGGDMEEIPERKLSITRPSDNATIPMGAGIFDVLVKASAELEDGESVALYLDGEKVDNAQNTLQWTLSYVIRGAHTLEAKWFAKDGSVLAVSEPITVFVLRPSIL